MKPVIDHFNYSCGQISNDLLLASDSCCGGKTFCSVVISPCKCGISCPSGECVQGTKDSLILESTSQLCERYMTTGCVSLNTRSLMTTHEVEDTDFFEMCQLIHNFHERRGTFCKSVKKVLFMILRLPKLDLSQCFQVDITFRVLYSLVP